MSSFQATRNYILSRPFREVKFFSLAQSKFDKIFVKKEIPDEIEEFEIDSKDEKIRLVDLLVHTKLASSKSEAKRLIQLGGVSIDGNRINDIDTIVELKESFVIKVGKRKFLRIKPKIKN